MAGCVPSCAVAGPWRPVTDDGVWGVGVGESRRRGVRQAGDGWVSWGYCVKCSSIATGGMKSAALLLGKQLCWRSSDGRVASSRMLEQRNGEAWRAAARQQ